MSTKKISATIPLTIDLPVSLIEKIETLKNKSRLATVSDAVRVALAQFDMDSAAPGAEPRKQISVRLPADVKARLARVAARKKTSIGAILRMAIEACNTRPQPKKTKPPPKTRPRKRR